MTALYNEIDEYAADWLENLIRAGHIAPGVVDRRSIVDLTPDDVARYEQVHFFAGIGVWSYGLRRAGWRDDRRVWTGSCPCQPFSAAGKGGGFDDERHLWPAFFHLIEQCRPDVVLGEQVASKDGLAWLDLVQSDVEGAGYAFGPSDTCSAGFGAPHIRQRLRFAAVKLADASGERRQQIGRSAFGDEGANGRQPYCDHVAASDVETGELADTADAGQFGRRPSETGNGRDAPWIEPERLCAAVELAYPFLQQRSDRQPGIGAAHDAHGRDEGSAAASGLRDDLRPGPTNGFWRDSDWLHCRDGKWRPVESGTFPLAHGAPARVGRLRAYGNAVDAEATREFCEAVKAAIDGVFA